MQFKIQFRCVNKPKKFQSVIFNYSFLAYWSKYNPEFLEIP